MAKDLKTDRSDLFRCIQFAKKYPELSNQFDFLSWKEIIAKYLPEQVERELREFIISYFDEEFSVAFQEYCLKNRPKENKIDIYG
jgi:hypothetical protein